ncbi:MAG: hypothetical protein JWM53_2306, partial [bacterium]|nr:hypothetical protein [bacterium]
MIVERRYDEAVEFCRFQLAGSPRCVTLRLWLARALALQGSTAAAAAQLRECLRIDPTCAEARAMLGELHARGAPAVVAKAPAPSVSLLDEEADGPTNVRRPRRTTPSAVPAVERPRPVAVERPRPVAVERPRP